MAANSCGTAGWTGPKPGDPDVNDSILRATPAFGGIDLNWTLPLGYPEAVTKVNILRGITDNPSGAIFVDATSGTFYHDKQNNSTKWYYWIQLISIHGTIGDLIGPASATARPLIADLIQELTGKIDASYLANQLKVQLDQISFINADLLKEIKSREDANVSLAQALAQAAQGVDQAYNFIHTEIQSRVAKDAAIAERIDLVASVVDGDYAAVIQTMRTDINSNSANLQGVNQQLISNINKTNALGALWSAQVNVNGFIGGFGVYNNGQMVDAAFDVDRFYIGRTNASARRPFIVQDGVTYIDEAVIRSLTFSKLRDEAGAFIVENGRVRADYITIGTAQIKNANIENLSIDGIKVSTNALDTRTLAPGATFGAAYAQATDKRLSAGGEFGHLAIYGFPTDGLVLVYLDVVSMIEVPPDTYPDPGGGGD